MADVVLRFEAREAAALTALQRLVQAEGGVEAGWEKVITKIQEFSKEEARATREAERSAKQLAREQEREARRAAKEREKITIAMFKAEEEAAKEAEREKKRIAREEARERQRIARERDRETAELFRREEQLAREAAREQQRLAREVADEHRRVRGVVEDIAGALGFGGILTVGGAMAGIVDMARRWADLQDEIAEKIRTAGREAVALALIQQPGQAGAAVLAAADLGARFGRTTGESFEVVQAMQSLTGSLEQGLRSAAVIFAAAEGGIQVSEAKEAVTIGVSSGVSAEEALNLAFIAGEQSVRSPEDMVRVAPMAQNFGRGFEGFAQGMAVAAAISGTDEAERIKEHLKRIGVALNVDPEDPTLKASFRRLGIDERSLLRRGVSRDDFDMARLRALHEAGIDEVAELQKFGFNMEQSLSLSRAVAAFPMIQANFDDMMARGRAEGQIFSSRLAREQELLDEGLPGVATERVVRGVEARIESIKSGTSGDIINDLTKAGRDLEQALVALQAFESGSFAHVLVGDDKRMGRFAETVARLLPGFDVNREPVYREDEVTGMRPGPIGQRSVGSVPLASDREGVELLRNIWLTLDQVRQEMKAGNLSIDTAERARELVETVIPSVIPE